MYRMPLALMLLLGMVLCRQNMANDPDLYNVVWETPSQDAAGTMPLGNGDISLNAWVQPNGELLFYIGKTDSWGDNGRLLKVGRLRISLDPAPSLSTEASAASATVFRQTLRLSDATMVVEIGKGDQAVTVQLWVDANHPVIHVDVESQQPVAARAQLELCATRARN